MLQSLTNADAIMMAAVPVWVNNAWNIAQIILGFSLIVFVHELGHFLAAKWAGVRVERFAVGFGKELVGFTKGETRYSFNVLPLGGYVKMLGQEDFVVDKTGELKVKEDPRSFTNKSVGKRMVIVSAGVIMNLIFAAVVFTIIAMVGQYKAPAVLGLVDQNMPAGRAGLESGDRIIEVNGEKVQDFSHLFSLISLSDDAEELVLTVERDGKIVEPSPRVIPEYQADHQRRQIGISGGWNFRVANSVAMEGTEPRDNQLHDLDLITHVIQNGERVPVGNGTPFVRAYYAAQGRPIELIVQRPTKPEELTTDQIYNPEAEVESVEKQVSFQPVWTPMPFEASKEKTGSLLGMTPRLSAWGIDRDKSFATAGLQEMDVITKIGTVEFPNYDELKAEFEKSAGKSIPLEVRRAGAANLGLTSESIDWLIEQRESLIAAALNQNVASAKALVADLIQKSSLAKVEQDSINEKLAAIGDAKSWQKWLDRADIHALTLNVPGGSWLGGKVPTLDATFQCLDENVVFVADVKGKLGDRPTPASTAGIPRFAVIVSVDNTPVRHWYEFSNALRERAGKTVNIAYRHFEELHTTTLAVPESVDTAFNLTYGDRITKIADRSTAEIVTGKDADGNEINQKVILPDWRAAYAILKENIGKTVPVEYARLNGERGTGSYAAAADNIDPWPQRIQYQLAIVMYPLQERHPIHNPVDAFVAGTNQAYRATVDTILTIKQMITRNVGVKNVSGPLGIMAFGSQVADKGMIDLFWLLALLSANLAVINFLPLPIVDGGLFLFLILEKIRGEPVSIKVQVATQIVGIALIGTIFILVTAQDLLKLIS